MDIAVPAHVFAPVAGDPGAPDRMRNARDLAKCPAQKERRT